MKECKKCGKDVNKKNTKNCPTCGYVYCPECYEDAIGKRDKDKCMYCESVNDFRIPPI